MPKSEQAVELIEPLLKAIKSKPLVWLQQRGMERALVARPDERDLALLQKNLPVGTSMEWRPLRGPRVSVKGPRDYANRSTRVAHWPEDAMQCRRISNLMCVLSGQADFQLGNYLLHAQEGDFVFILPGTPFPDGSCPHLEGANRSERSCDLLWMTSSGSSNALGCWICHSQGERHFERPLESCLVTDQQSVGIYDLLMQEITLERPRSRAICAGLLTALFNSVVEAMETGQFFQFAYQMEMEAKKTNLNDPAQRACDYIRMHLHRHLTINDVAQHVYLSRAQFTKVFREKTGKTFTEYLTECRFREARELLKNSQWSIQMVCERIGVTPSRLRMIFQEYLGVSPMEYRKSQRSEAKTIRPHKKAKKANAGAG